MFKLATLVSRVFEPMVVLLVVAMVAGWRANLTPAQFRTYGLFVGFIFAAVVAARLWLMAKAKANWDVSERHKRVRPLIILLGLLLFSGWMINHWQNQFLTQLFTLFNWWLVGFWLITLWYKISGHSAIITLGSALMVDWFGPSWWPLFLLIPLVGWARVVRRDHTVGQVLAGILYSSLLLLAVK